MASNEDAPLQTRQSLIDSAKQCQILFEDIKRNIMDKDNFKYPLALAAQHLPGNTEAMSIPYLFHQRLDQLKSWDIRILVAGDISAGKSTLLNRMMGNDYMPVQFRKATKVMCDIEDTFHRPEMRATLKFKSSENGQRADKYMLLGTDPNVDNWKILRKCIKTKEEDGETVKRVLIKWPLILYNDWHQTTPMKPYRNSLLQTKTSLTTSIKSEDGQTDYDRPSVAGDEDRDNFRVIFADTPGITYKADVDSEVFDEITKGTTIYKGFIFLIKADNVEIRKEGDVESSFIQRSGEWSPESSLFIVNKFDLVPDGEKEDFIEDVKNQLLRKWPRINEMNIVFMSAQENDVESSFIQRSGEWSPESSLFIVNKFDLVPDGEKEDFIEDVKNQLLRKWPRINEMNIVFMSAQENDVESSFIQRSGEWSPESSLFIVNKFDLVPDGEKEDFIEDVKNQLLRKWPRINEMNIVFMSAQENIIYQGGTSQSFVVLIQDFVNKVIRLSLEEHCLWAMNVLEIVCAIMKTGKNWISARHSKVQLRRSLSQLQSDAFKLSEELTSKPANILDEIMKAISREFVIHLDVNLEWDISEIDSRIPKLDIDWKDIIEEIDLMICEKIFKVKEDQIGKLRVRYEKQWRDIYKSELEVLKKLEESLQGLKINDESKVNVTQGVATALAPVAFSGALRLAPFPVPFLFLALPIPLVLKMVYDEYKEYKNDKDREKLKADKIEFVKSRTCQIIQKINNSLSKDNVVELRDSPLFCHLFGQFPRNILCHRVEDIINILNMLLTLDIANTQSDYKMCNRTLAHVMEIYTNGVLVHDVKPERITFEKKQQNNRIPLGHQGSVVYKAKLDKAGDVAVKELQYKSCLPFDQQESMHSDLDVYRECFMLRQLSKTPCEHIVKFLGSSFMSETIDNRTVCTLWLVFERCDGTLKDVIETSPKIRREKYDAFKWYADQLLRGLEFLHDRNIVHRDMKPSNCLLKKVRGTRPTVKIADVGAAKQKDLICTTARNRGTFAYWAPEIVRSSTIKFHSKASDIYSLGLILWELWFREFAYNQYNIINGEVPSKLPDVPNVKQILKVCLAQDIFARASVKSLQQLPLLKENEIEHSNKVNTQHVS